MKQKTLSLFLTIAVLVLFSQVSAGTDPGSTADNRTPERSLTATPETPERTVRQVKPSEDLTSSIR